MEANAERNDDGINLDTRFHSPGLQLLQKDHETVADKPLSQSPLQMFEKADEVKPEGADTMVMAESMLEKTINLMPWSEHEALTEKPSSPLPLPSPFFQLADHAKHSVDMEVGIKADRSQDKASRLPRWSRHETLVLVEAKRVAEATLKQNKEEKKKLEQNEKGRDGSFKGKWIMESKWLLISVICKQRGVDREANQCRKRWGNLFGDYKRIKEWQRLSGVEPFWMMRNDARKENKLPSTFDPEVFEAMERLMGRKPVGALPEMISESTRPVSDEVLFSDIEHPVQEEDAAAAVAPVVGSCTPATVVGSSTPAPDACEGKSPKNFLGWKKRKQPCSVDPEDIRGPLVYLLESSCKQLISHLQANNQMIHLDRVERKEQSESLLSVLDKLADVLASNNIVLPYDKQCVYGKVMAAIDKTPAMISNCLTAGSLQIVPSSESQQRQEGTPSSELHSLLVGTLSSGLSPLMGGTFCGYLQSVITIKSNGFP